MRNIKKHKGFSFINITGLAVGMACCVLILIWVQDELSYDSFHDNYNELYRTVMSIEGDWITSSPWALAPILKREYPEIQMYTRYFQRNLLFAYEENRFNESTAFVDPDFFEMFTFPFMKGSSKSAFPTSNSAVITEKTAKKYFGNEDSLGKVFTLNDDTSLTVTGIIKNVPSNSNISFDVVASVRLIGEKTLNSWSLGSSSYVLLQKNTSPDTLRDKISGLIMKYDKRIDQTTVLDLQPLSRIHLYSIIGGGNIIYVYIFSTIAVIILLIACINFMNLSTARGCTRAKEVGMRKVVGARRSNVIRQFLGESLLLSFVALL